MAMVGIDWLGPITPACTATGAKYVILAVDYFTRFVWTKAYANHGALETIDLLRDFIAPIFGWMEGLYSDNGPHFINYNLLCVLLEHGVNHFTGPVSHPSSTGLLERKVQEMLSLISKKCIERRSIDSWGLGVREHVLTMNTKGTTTHGFTGAKLMLGFNPKQVHFDIKPKILPNLKDAEASMPTHRYQIYSAMKDEDRLLASEVASYTHGAAKGLQRKQRIPREGDLVMVWDSTKEGQHGRKLDAKWLDPRILVKFTKDQRSAWVREVHGVQKLRRYSIDDMVLYYPKSQAAREASFPISSVKYPKSRIGNT